LVRNYLESIDSEWYNFRLARFLVVVLLAFAFLFARLIYLQVIEGQEYRRLSEINSIRLQDIAAPRGLIFDRNGHLLVENRPSFDLHIVLKDAKPLAQTLENLSRFVGESPEALMARIQSARKTGPFKPILLKADIGRDMLAAIEVHKYDLPGIAVHISSKRHYLYNQYAVHLLGYLGEINAEELQGASYAECKSGDYIGRFGVEKTYEQVLRGKRGGRQVEVNATGQVVRVLNTVKAQAGRNIVLTIDHELQLTTERLLEGKVGAAVGIDPRSGEVLAMASNPSFDPNIFVRGLSRDQWRELISNPLRPMENKALQAEYPPASTYKIVTALAGLEENVITPETRHFCPGFYRFANRDYRCWRKGGHGSVDLNQAMAQSCDVYFYKVGEALGVDRLAWYAKGAGLGAPTGISIEGEGRGLIPTSQWKQRRFGEPWYRGETLSIAIGQGYNLTTPMQMAFLMGAVGHDGIRYAPILVKSVQVAGNEMEVTVPRIIGRLPTSEANLALLQNGLWAVVNEQRGTAFRARIKELAYSGKTGTAQVVGREALGESEGVHHFKDHAWFVAYAPSEKPKIAIAVLVEHGEHGSSTAAPIANEMIRTYLKIEPLDSPKVPPSVRSASAIATQTGILQHDDR
jgi:penicillin-binding protein 2